MSEMIQNDPEFFELKFYPENFARAGVTNECRNISWGDLATLPGSVIEKYGRHIDVGFLDIDTSDLKLLSEYHDPIVQKALESRYGSTLFLEGSLFGEFADFLNAEFCGHLIDHEPTKEALVFERLGDDMYWPASNVRDWSDYEY